MASTSTYSNSPTTSARNYEPTRWVTTTSLSTNLTIEIWRDPFQGSGGLGMISSAMTRLALMPSEVDKIIISQNSLKTFINTISPGAYASMTKVNFRMLDQSTIKPVGIYGSKEEILYLILVVLVAPHDRFHFVELVTCCLNRVLRKLIRRFARGCIFFVQALQSLTDASKYMSSTGLSKIHGTTQYKFAAIGYLTRMCDQIVALVSSEHARKMVWNDVGGDHQDEDGGIDGDDGGDRIIRCVVQKTTEQEESVQIREGFKVTSEYISQAEPSECGEQCSVKPSLLLGETAQGTLTVQHRPSKLVTELFRPRSISDIQLEGYLYECAKWKHQSAVIQQRYKKILDNRIRNAKDELAKAAESVTNAIRNAVIDDVVALYPFIDKQAFQYTGSGTEGPPGSFSQIIDIYPKASEAFRLNTQALHVISDPEFRDIKDRLCLLVRFMSRKKDAEDSKLKPIKDAIVAGGFQEAERVIKASYDKPRGTFAPILGFLGRVKNSIITPQTNARSIDSVLKEAHEAALKVTDSEFFRIVAKKKQFQDRQQLAELVENARQKAKSYLEHTVPRVITKVILSIKEIQEEDCHAKITAECSYQEGQERDEYKLQLIQHINNSSTKVQRRYTLRIDSVQEEKKSLVKSRTFKLWGLRESEEDPVTCYTVHPMNVTEEDKHNLQLDPSSIPSPRFPFQHQFELPPGHTILRAQFLEGERLLLVVADRVGSIFVYLETLAAVFGVIQRKGRKLLLKREKIGQDVHLAFDESRRMLGVVSSDKCTSKDDRRNHVSQRLLHVFVYDDVRGFQAQGSAIKLSEWYDEGVRIRHACFICGSEEILLVDSQAQARVFSLVTMQFRPAVLHLPQVPTGVHCTPDGSCVLVIQPQESGLAITAYHLSSFGSTEGIPLNIPDLAVGEPLVVTSLVKRTAVHLLKLDLSSRCCQSYALDITRRHTEFVFRDQVNRNSTSEKAHETARNCLIGCHSEVWTRFPMIHSFERTARKPTGNALKSVKVSAASFDVFAQELCDGATWNVSQYRAGEWIVDFLCLIPIHIAVTKDNRFIPLKDGVYSPRLERELLGADINRIVDNISFGWYESLFQSYMATKVASLSPTMFLTNKDQPVRVVSSMGEQSVGKSYALNHLVDTSFAGSAMRTTEGVWMSVTPTEKELIVALDFEGVHSIERSAQEDTLLVLFNTAISNLVLFRNNFALSRDITGLFQSFQSSATVLDPAENPSLFQSTLVIIIKDVVEADKTEIGREFSLRFGKIVQAEQDANFISRLHAGRLTIIPWPVIESNEFYKLFTELKKCLDQQPVTHPAAGEFLHKMKALMAKLKANDWGAMSQTMASHRAQLLLSMLPNALMYGMQEIDPDLEPLKNIDTDTPIQFPDTQLRLFLAAGGLSQSESREKVLAVLCDSWDRNEMRQHLSDPEWAGGLSQYLERIVDLRIDHVREWLTQNLSRFQTGHASIEELRRTFENASVDLRSNVQLCRLQCASCQLLCIQSRLHDGPHNCRTDHACIHQCDFCKEGTGENRACSMIGGHAGKHICVVNAHLCGKPCKSTGKFGCLNQCTKVADHPDEHLCAALVHGCGEPCDLSGIKLIDRSTYACPGTCRIPSDVDHTRHRCDTRLCSITCQLCKRLCSHQDHMHGLEEGAIHLCGEEHFCTDECSVPGICEIETAPYSIEATFTGRHETFQYTKYSQVAKRLKCVKSIPPGQLKHTGQHNHSLDKKVVHFCQNKCENCGYFCTLPLGHPQQEHETRHGSMSRTRWVVDESDDAAALEVEGRKFSTNDEGAPMMCNLVCQAIGRHVHIDYCRADDPAACAGRDEIQHIAKRILPDPDRPKDYMTHSLFWKKSGFKDPYSKEEQANFAKCDAMCSGREHAGDAGTLPQPSYCTLAMFHQPSDARGAAPAIGYVSKDGHHFTCQNPVVMQHAYHVIFVADRFGAVLSSLYGFWSARAAAVGSGASAARRDAYSVILFNSRVVPVIENDFTSDPDQLLDAILPYEADGGTNFTAAITGAASVMERNWSTERSPVVIFLSDGECQIADQTMQDLCRTSIRLGKAVSFHAVSFGRDLQYALNYLLLDRLNAPRSSLRRMVEIAREAQNNAPGDPLTPAVVTIISSYSNAEDTVRHLLVADVHILLIYLNHKLGPTCRDIPWDCGVIAEAERIIDATR
ncbi:hypothetical protein F5J12DRAFT_928807 [Pisolithus orientalis]|uniref:uncharacterized protein n=1 Tax=Pisolithus orientalis TaxID=936130 RepID=UPI002225465E|nr:uncharacterized protein F5J12DRAFT_928807 [Pisolithus orientalis]KAI5998966.1 hypothetical protein F5J12DRAFT_928807 [Pisolithus orientalis]